MPCPSAWEVMPASSAVTVLFCAETIDVDHEVKLFLGGALDMEYVLQAVLYQHHGAVDAGIVGLHVLIQIVLARPSIEGLLLSPLHEVA